MVRPLHKIGELDGGPILTKALGAEGAAKVTANLRPLSRALAQRSLLS